MGKLDTGDFQSRFDRYLPVQRTFYDVINRLMDVAGWDKNTFMELTSCDEMTYSRLRNKKKAVQLKTAVTLCIAFKLDISMSTDLIGLAGYRLIPSNPLHAAYAYLIEHSGEIDSIEDCNDFLKEFGYRKQTELLGTQERKSRIT